MQWRRLHMVGRSSSSSRMGAIARRCHALRPAAEAEATAHDHHGRWRPPSPSAVAEEAKQEEANEHGADDTVSRQTVTNRCPDAVMSADAVTQISTGVRAAAPRPPSPPAPVTAAQSVCAPDLLALPAPPLLELLVDAPTPADTMGVSQHTQKWILTAFVMFNGLITPGQQPPDAPPPPPL